MTFPIDIDADFESHHIEGYARAAQERGQDSYFSCPLISQIDGNLWSGGCVGGVRLPDDFKYVVSLYQWEQYKIGPNTHRDTVLMYDAGNIPDPTQLHELADMVNDYRAKGKTLVHCQAGLNRSGLVSGLALVKSGMSPTAAIALLREKRSPMVLCNEAFEKWLLSQGDQNGNDQLTG